MTRFTPTHCHTCILCADCLYGGRASPCSVSEAEALAGLGGESADRKDASVVAGLQGGCLVMTDEQRSSLPGEISCLLTWTDATELSLAGALESTFCCGPRTGRQSPAWLWGDTGLSRATSAGKDGIASPPPRPRWRSRRGPGLPRPWTGAADGPRGAGAALPDGTRLRAHVLPM